MMLRFALVLGIAVAVVAGRANAHGIHTEFDRAFIGHAVYEFDAMSTETLAQFAAPLGNLEGEWIDMDTGVAYRQLREGRGPAASAGKDLYVHFRVFDEAGSPVDTTYFRFFTFDESDAKKVFAAEYPGGLGADAESLPRNPENVKAAIDWLENEESGFLAYEKAGDTHAWVTRGGMASARYGYGYFLPAVEEAMAGMKKGGKRLVRVPRERFFESGLYPEHELDESTLGGEVFYVEVSLFWVR